MTYAERPTWQQNALCLGMNPNLLALVRYLNRGSHASE